MGEMPAAAPTPLRALLLADTHGQLHPQILALVGGSDLVVHAGDIGHPDILAQLAADHRRVVAVRGNNDTPAKWPPAQGALLQSLEPVAELALPGGSIVVVHGDRVNPAGRRHELLRRRFPGARLVLYGHSHRQVIDRSATPWVANPGAAGRSRTFGGSGCILLTIAGGRWHLDPLHFPLSAWGR